MLKPRYSTIGESVSDFNNLLEDMNKTSPLEYSTHEEVDQIVREEQDLQRIEREVAHMENVLGGLGLNMEESDRQELGKQYEQVARRYGQAANRAKVQVESGKRKGMGRLFMTTVTEAFDRLLGKAREYKAKHEEISVKRGGIVAESRDVAVNSQYRSQGSALERFRVLAGMEEQVAMPRDAGIFGSTRHNANFDEMAQPFEEKHLSEGATDMQRTQGLQRRYTKSGKSISMGAPTARERTARAKAEKHGQSASHAHRKADLRQTVQGPKSEDEDREYQEGGGSRRTKGDRQDAHMSREAGKQTPSERTPKIKMALDRSAPAKLKGLHKIMKTKDNDGLSRELTKSTSDDRRSARKARLYGKTDRLSDRTGKADRIKKGDYDNAEKHGGSRLEKYPAAHNSTDKAYNSLRRLMAKRKARR